MKYLFPLRPLLANLPHGTQPVGVAPDEALEVHASLALRALVGAAAALARSGDAVVLLRRDLYNPECFFGHIQYR